MSMPAPLQGESELPNAIVVDLDHTLVRTDTLFEMFCGLLFRAPLAALLMVVGLIGGRARFKSRLAQVQELDAAALPYREDLIAFLISQKAAGRRLHLVTAADQSIAAKVAEHCGFFDSYEGSNGTVNLKGTGKARRLLERFPEGFAYVGDSKADLAVWRHSASLVLAGASRGVSHRAQGLGKPIEATFADDAGGLKTWLRALRVHQWAKNVLVFIPLLLSQKYLEPQAVLQSLGAFVALCLVASATYLINDASDIAADRRHSTKRRRPLASGDLHLSQALVAIVVLLALGMGLAAAISPQALLGLCAYGAITLTYTFVLKRHALLDVATLGGLYAIRIMLGASAIGAPQSPWLLTFAMFFFFSISLAKRYAEIANLLAVDETGKLNGRGYQTGDAPTVLAIGVAASTASVLIVVLYLMEDAFPSNVYAQPNWLWVAPLVLTLWVGRLWLVAGRGELDEDPVAFAIKDRVSWVLTVPLILGFGLAVVG